MRFLEILRGFFRPQFLSWLPLVSTVAGSLLQDDPAPTYTGGSGGTGSGAPPMYVPTGLNTADTTWQQFLSQIAGPVSALGPERAIAGGNKAAAADTQLAAFAKSLSTMMMGEATKGFSREGALWNAGADPQNALHDRTQQQLVNSSRAGTSARGIGMSPYAAGVENKAVGDFNIDWQNQQLQRMISGGAGANAAGSYGGTALGGAQTYYGQVPGYLMQAGLAPTQALAGYSQLPASIMQELIPYMNQGIGAGGAAANFGLAQQQFASQQNTAQMNALMTGLSKGFAGGGGAGGGGGGSFNPNSSYNSEGTFQPYYTGMDAYG